MESGTEATTNTRLLCIDGVKQRLVRWLLSCRTYSSICVLSHPDPADGRKRGTKGTRGGSHEKYASTHTAQNMNVSTNARPFGFQSRPTTDWHVQGRGMFRQGCVMFGRELRTASKGDKEHIPLARTSASGAGGQFLADGRLQALETSFRVANLSSSLAEAASVEYGGVP